MSACRLCTARLRRCPLSYSARTGSRAATTRPALQPAARPPRGGSICAVSTPLWVSSQEVTEFEFHISPACSSSRPHTGVGTDGTRVEESLGAGGVDVHGHGGGGFALVGDDACRPASDLVAEQPKSARPFGSYGAFGHDASPFSVYIGDGCHFDHEAAFGDDDCERRVVEVARAASLDQRRYRLEHLAARPDDGLARSERDPVERHGRDRHRRAVSDVSLEEIVVHASVSARRVAGRVRPFEG